VTYHPAYANVKKLLSSIHLLLTPNEEHVNVFPDIPIVGFRRGKSLKDMLVRAKLPDSKTYEVGESKKCGSKRCGVCEYINETQTFSDKENTKSYNIRSKSCDCNSIGVVYLVTCKTCNIQYVGSTVTKFRFRFNNYKSCNRSFSVGNSVTQASFHHHFHQSGHNETKDWSFTLIDQADNINTLRHKESFWQHKLNTFFPNGLNERDVALELE